LYRNDLEHAQVLERVLRGSSATFGRGGDCGRGQSLDAVVVACGAAAAAIDANPAAFYDEAEGRAFGARTLAAPSTSPLAHTPSSRRAT
jgi:hypothetical protein